MKPPVVSIVADFPKNPLLIFLRRIHRRYRRSSRRTEIPEITVTNHRHPDPTHGRRLTDGKETVRQCESGQQGSPAKRRTPARQTKRGWRRTGRPFSPLPAKSAATTTSSFAARHPDGRHHKFLRVSTSITPDIQTPDDQKAEKGGGRQHLIRNGVEKFSQIRHQIAGAGDPSVKQIGQRGRAEHRHRNQIVKRKSSIRKSSTKGDKNTRRIVSLLGVLRFSFWLVVVNFKTIPFPCRALTRQYALQVVFLFRPCGPERFISPVLPSGPNRAHR